MLSLDLNLLFTIINLIIFYVLLKKFLFKPVRGIMEKRKALLAEEAAQAEQMKQEALALKQEYEDALKGVDQKGEELLHESRKKAEEEYEEIIKAAKLQEQEILKYADEMAKEKKEKTIREVQHQIADLALAAATQMVSSGAGSKQDERIMDEFLSQTGVIR